MLTIHQLAEAAKVTVATVRYLQRRGLLEDMPSQLAGKHDYSQQHVFRVQFIRRAQALGFTLEEITEHLAAVGPEWHGEMRELAVKKAALAPDRSNGTPESNESTTPAEGRSMNGN
jgi:MerR family mercuric resistance operon transcriptional regulator